MSFLFREFRINLGSGTSAKLGDGDMEMYKEAKTEFQALVSGHEGIDYVRQVYETMDRLVAENIAGYNIVCGTGCAYCCNQMVCCTKLEMDLIVDFLNSKSREKRLVKKEAIKRSKKYRGFLESVGLLKKAFDWSHLGLQAKNALYKKPCPFLRHNMCGIYPVRPPDCRSARVPDKRCGYGHTEKIKGIKFFLDQVVSDILAEEDMRLQQGEIQVVPLFGWVESVDFSYFFR